MSFERYAEYYDIIYLDKDYEKECDFLEEIFRKYSDNVKKILDLGCGSGGHAIPLSKRGYDVVGIDRSEYMIKKAREKTKDVSFLVGDITEFRLKDEFDACLAMFAVMDYITDTDSLIKAFKNIYDHLRDGGLFIFDVWNGLAVMRLLPERRAKIMQKDKIKIIRISEPELDAFNHICRVHYRMFVLEENKLIDEIEEEHVVRFFFPREIEYYLKSVGFEVKKICPFLDLNGKVDETVWNMSIIAKK